MRHKTKVLLSYLMTLTLILGCILVPSTTKAEELSSSETVIKTYTGTVNGTERTLIVTWDSFFEESKQYIKIGEMDLNMIWFDSYDADAGINQYGAVVILNSDHSLMCWSYDLVPVLNSIKFYLIEEPNSKEVRYDIASLTIDNGIVTGYKTFAGEEYPLPSFDEMKAFAAPDSSIPEPLYIPKGMEPVTPNPTTPTPDTPASATQAPVTDTPVSTSKTPTPKVHSKKVTIKTEKKAKVLYEGDEFIGQYTLKKSTLTWKGPKKKGKATSVKYAGFIKKSKNLVYITQKGKAYTVSFKTGKKKLIVKKKAKKLILSNKFVSKIKTAYGKVNVTNK